MTIETTRYKRRDIFVDEVQVTEENMEEVAEWCHGQIKSYRGARYIHVRVLFPKDEKQTRAFVGDHILYSPSGFKVYTDRGFHKSFEVAEEEGPDVQHEIEMK